MTSRPFRFRPRRGRWLLLGVALAATACSGGSALWDVRGLTARHPQVADARGHRLVDLVPYVWPRSDELVGFLCRWDVTPIRVAFEEGVSAGELALLRRALESWQFAVPGLAFRQVGIDGSPHIRIAVGEPSAGFSGQTRAECVVDLATFLPDSERVAASLLEARVVLRRTDHDKLGREVPLTEAEFLATAAHELGHALGFQGHALRGRSILRGEVSLVRRMGEGLLDGSPLVEPSMRALYAIPSGTVVATRRLAPRSTAAIDRLAVLARERGYRGPTVRVGDRAARLSWWGADDHWLGVRLGQLKPALRRRKSLEIELDPVAQAWLGP